MMSSGEKDWINYRCCVAKQATGESHWKGGERKRDLCPLVAEQIPSNNLHLAWPGIVVSMCVCVCVLGISWRSSWLPAGSRKDCRDAKLNVAKPRKRVAEQSGSILPSQGARLGRSTVVGYRLEEDHLILFSLANATTPGTNPSGL